MKSHPSRPRCGGTKKKNDMAAELSTLRKGGNGREAEYSRKQQKAIKEKGVKRNSAAARRSTTETAKAS